MFRAIDKRVYFTLMTALTVSGFIVICTLGQSLHRQKVAAKMSVPEMAVKTGYTVREYNGRIGIFAGESSQPFRIISYDVSLMPEFDREQLREGITVETEYELNRFIEDIAS